MKPPIRAVITDSASYVPEKRVHFSEFFNKTLYRRDGSIIEDPEAELTERVLGNDKHPGTQTIWRHLAEDDEVTSDLAAKALQNLGNLEELETIITAHNFGDRNTLGHVEITPSIVARSMSKAGLVGQVEYMPFDIIAGCPGGAVGLQIAAALIQSGWKNVVGVLAAEVLSRGGDAASLNSVLYGDLAAVIRMEGIRTTREIGLLAYGERAVIDPPNNWIMRMGQPYEAIAKGEIQAPVFQMDGNRVFTFFSKQVPKLMKETLDKVELHIKDVDQIIYHQANFRMLYLATQRAYVEFGDTLTEDQFNQQVLINIREYSNTSNVSYMKGYDEFRRGTISGHKLEEGMTYMLVTGGATSGATVHIFKAAKEEVYHP